MYSSSTSYDAMEAGVAAGMLIVYLIAMVISLAISIVMIVSTWKLFTKAGEAGWKSIIPFYSSYISCKILFGNGWLFLIIFASIIPAIGSLVVAAFMIYNYIKYAQVFGKGIGYGIGLILLPIIFFPMLAFGSAEYDESKVYFLSQN